MPPPGSPARFLAACSVARGCAGSLEFRSSASPCGRCFRTNMRATITGRAGRAHSCQRCALFSSRRSVTRPRSPRSAWAQGAAARSDPRRAGGRAQGSRQGLGWARHPLQAPIAPAGDGGARENVKFAGDSPLEEGGFEPSVPLTVDAVGGSPSSSPRAKMPPGRVDRPWTRRSDFSALMLRSPAMHRTAHKLRRGTIDVRGRHEHARARIG